MNKKFIIGYDLGTSSLKAALIDETGNVVADSSQNYPFYTPKPGHVEQDPSDWWNAMCTVTASLLRKSGQGPDSVAAISICAQMCGVIPVDKHGKPITNCIIWLDTRSKETARRITHGAIRLAGYGVMSLLRWLWYTNGAPNLAGRDPVSKILWLKEHAPEQWSNIDKFLDVKDYLVYRCCRRFITTPDCAHLTWLMDSRPHKKCWSDALLSRLDINRQFLPEICNAEEIIGELDRVSAGELGLKTGTPVVAGAGDLTASALGAGTLASNEPHLHLGSSAWLGVHVKRRKVDVINGIAAICAAVSDTYLLVAAQQSGAMSLDWAMKILETGAAVNDYDAINDAVTQSPAGARGLMYTPWLQGECVPRFIQPNRAEFFHLSASHDKQDMYRAVMEGVALNIRWAQRAFTRHSGEYQKLRAFGGAVQSPTWCRILADTLQVPVLQMEQPHLTGAIGSAMLAAVALGWYENTEEALAMSRANQVFEPDISNRDRYDDAFEQFLALYRQEKTAG